MSKMEQRIEKLLDAYMEKHKNYVGEKTTGIFLYGFMSGVVFSYSGLLGYIFGIGTGAFLANNLKKYRCLIIDFIMIRFSSIINIAKSSTDK